jgi:hypothetical protein
MPGWNKNRNETVVFGDIMPLIPLGTKQSNQAHLVHYYYPAEGFGNLYRRVITNDFFTNLIRTTEIRNVAEIPLDTYGIVGAGSLIFTQLGCQVTLVSDRQYVLDRARALMDFNGISGVRFLQSQYETISIPENCFDLTWNFDRLQTLPDPVVALRELFRISKAIFISVPNAHNYGQYAHFVYHQLKKTNCEYVGPRKWMLRSPIRETLLNLGMEIIEEGVIDVPWWPGFPEFPNLVRRLLGRAQVDVDEEGIPETNPVYVSPTEVPQLRQKVERAAYIEKGHRIPSWVKLIFAHNLFILGCKPQYRQELGLQLLGRPKN